MTITQGLGRAKKCALSIVIYSRELRGSLFSFFCSPGANGHVKPLLCHTVIQRKPSVSCLTEYTMHVRMSDNQCDDCMSMRGVTVTG
jgi:hypothetical protein